jgi:hypothetical protein
VAKLGRSGGSGNRHVVRHGSGWAARTPGAPRVGSTHRTQAAAERAAKSSARKAGGGEVVIHGRNGRIRDSDTVGRRDPMPPRDTKH